MSLEKLEQQVLEWGALKGILPDPVALAQCNKTQEEVDELYMAIMHDDRAAAVDAIGDIIVTLIMQTQAWDTDLTECLSQAYKEISGRTGKMVNGVFVKDVEGLKR
jgi:NTP pyrophosphatase (non-canonical NTP hydrolase)